MKRLILAAAFVSASLAFAEEIPVIDVSQSTAPVDAVPVPVATAVPAATPVTPVPPKDTPQPVDPNTPKRVRLFLRELSIVQQAARAAGGDIKVTITPIGITAEDLIVPLTKSGWFNVRQDGDVVIIESRSDDPYRVKLNEDIAQLEKRRRVLLDQIGVLEKAAAESAHAALTGPGGAEADKYIPTGSEPRFTLSVIPQRAQLASPKPLESPDMRSDSSVVGSPVPATPGMTDVTPKPPSPSDWITRPATVRTGAPVPDHTAPVPVPSTPDDPTKPRSIEELNRSINPPGASSSDHYRATVPAADGSSVIQTQPETTDVARDPVPLVMNPRPRDGE